VVRYAVAEKVLSILYWSPGAPSTEPDPTEPLGTPDGSGKWRVFISSRRQVQPVAAGGPRPGVVGGATKIPPCCLTLEMMFLDTKI
jgi:hypothetical protein